VLRTTLFCAMIRQLFTEKTSRIVWTLLLAGAGIAHLIMPKWFVSYYPSYMPFASSAHDVVVISGLVEFVVAALLWTSRTRRIAWLSIAALMVLYTPVHVYVITHHDVIAHLPLNIPLWVAWLRLPVQFVFVWWAGYEAIFDHHEVRR
jgi:uncharacterized membrane protein